MNNNTVFKNVETFYLDLVQALQTADTDISMMYYAFDDGIWARKIAEALADRAAAGVRVRLMVDQFGLIADHWRNARKNQMLLSELKRHGIQVNLFKPKGRRLRVDNRLHTKICAIDQRIVFIGGSNIGDYYTTWDDSNLRIDGDLGHRFHDIYDFILCHTEDGACNGLPDLHLSHLDAGSAQIWLTVPRQRRDIRRALLKIILDARSDIYIRNWYFLPDREILDALRSQAERGINVHVLLSHKTRVRLIDFANLVSGNKLANSGGHVYRFTRRYMHAKVVWNDCGEILFGSANMDKKALCDNFECSLTMNDPEMAKEMVQAFKVDTKHSIHQDKRDFKQSPLLTRLLAYTCNLASTLL